MCALASVQGRQAREDAARNREVPGDQGKSFPLRKIMYKTGKFVSLFSGNFIDSKGTLFYFWKKSC